MKVADGPVSLYLNGTGSDEGYLRWRDYHRSYPNGEKSVYVHQLVAIANGADPWKVFSDGEYETHHKTGIKELNAGWNLTVVPHWKHFDTHVNGIMDKFGEIEENDQSIQSRG